MSIERRFYRLSKRCLDLVLSTLAFILLSPLMLFIAMAIKLTSEGPVIYKQKALGKEGKGFDFYKFRSMYINSDTNLHRRYTEEFIKHSKPYTVDEQGRNIYKIVNDPRVTPIGKILRRASLDELPQLVNVIKGDMSLVGPRPALPYQVIHYQEWHKRRFDVVPGLTGLCQVLGRNELPFEESIKLDLTYVEKGSLWLDFKILFKTFPALFRHHGI